MRNPCPHMLILKWMLLPGNTRHIEVCWLQLQEISAVRSS